MLCRILLGAGEGPGLPTAFHAAYGWFPPERRSIPSAMIVQGISVGFLVGSPVLTWIIQPWLAPRIHDRQGRPVCRACYDRYLVPSTLATSTEALS